MSDGTDIPRTSRRLFNPHGQFDAAYIPLWLMRMDISDGSKILYARMARYATRSGRCWAKQETLAEEVGKSKSTVKRYIGELIEADLIQCTRRGLQQSNIYEFVLHEWMYPAVEPYATARADAGSAESPDLGPQEVADLGFPIHMSKEGTKEVLEARSESAPRRIRAQPDDNNPEQDAGGKRKPSARWASAPAPAIDPRSRSKRPDSAAGLAQHFIDTVWAVLTPRQRGADPFNQWALARKFAGWKRDGVTPEEIRTMAQVFATEPMPKGKPIWIGFLAARARLLEQAQDAANSNRPAAERFHRPTPPGWESTA